MKSEPRYCGRCKGKDTMLICCECLREIKEERNTEVKQAFEKLLNSHVKHIPQFEINELLRKLGFGEE